MKILVLCPFGRIEPFANENLAKVARSDTDFEIECLEPYLGAVYPNYIYRALKCVNATVERIIKAEKEGYHGVMISCMVDPGLLEARSIVDIPVTGTLESSVHVACMMGARFSIIGCDHKNVEYIDQRFVDFYGIRSKIASLRWLGLQVPELFPDASPPDSIVERVLEVSRQCVEEDRAEVIIPGCTVFGAVFTNALKKDPVEVLGVPVLDPMIVAFKQTEMMVDLCQKTGYPAVSRIGFWKKPPQEELIQIREHLKGQPSPESFYW